ncbi:MAG TPA: RHS repeat-associated core domain-containing protein, partial [Saprospiraceae bacterium]|nr:RHS repeat-associated core domain-containing protein [Saprospiraceae bacterium]
DLNGNLYQDPYKKLDFIKYFHNNMPKDLTVNLGTGNVNKIRYTYDASGMKLRKQVFNNGNTSTALMDYVQGIEYNNGAIEAIPHSDGRAVYNGTTWRYEFNITDHLGNVRAVISDLDNDKILDFTGSSTTNEVINSYTYYPFGMVFGNNSPANNTTTPDTKYQYNGKEFNSDLGLNLLDYGARWYDPAIGRFTGVDPLASAFNATSAYVYTLNNPINMIDPDGRAPDWIYDQLKDGSYKKREGASNDGGSTFHTYNDRNGNTHYFNQKENTFVTIKPGQIDKAIADRKEKTRSVVRKTGEVINNVGDGIAAIGYVAAPFTEGASLVVAGVGEGVSLGGKAITNSANFEESGATTKNMVNLGVDLVTVLAPLPLENLVKKSNLDDVSKKIIRSEIGKVTQTTEFVVKKEIEDNK